MATLPSFYLLVVRAVKKLAEQTVLAPSLSKAEPGAQNLKADAEFFLQEVSLGFQQSFELRKSQTGVL
jgi:hypothetical protein